ncbi:MAG: TRAP transporter TatT component family protein [Myxococcota bacterium]
MSTYSTIRAVLWTSNATWPDHATVLPMRTLSLIIIVTLSGCFKGRSSARRRNPAAQVISIGQMRFDERGQDPDAVDDAIGIWEEGLAAFPQNAGLLLRLSRAWTEQTLHDPTRSPQGYEQAREYGIRCLMSDPTVDSLVQTFGRLDLRAVRESNNAACLSWTALAWSRWVMVQGAGASLDLALVQGLARRAVALNPDYREGLPHHVLGIALALPPEPLKPDLEGAREHLRIASEAAPDRLIVLVDTAELVLGPLGDARGYQALLQDVMESAVSEDSPQAYWNRAAQRRAAALLERGARPRWSVQGSVQAP